jgi:hypothetical protein
MILRRTRILVPLLAVSLALVAAMAGPAAAQSKSDKAILKAGVITKADFPGGWTSKKSTSSDRAYNGIAECKKIKSAVDSAKKKVPRAQSREFQAPGSRGTTAAEDSVYVFKDANAATSFLANYQAPEAATCFEKGTAKVTSSQAGAGQPTVSPVTDLQGVGDDATGYEIAIPFNVQGQTATLYIDFIAIRVGRTLLGFNFSNLNERITGGPSIVQAVVARVGQAQGSA